ncbi:MAG: bifunctional metallophosphatase/5'-nucleotidase [Deltaproteobacteria bacterium]|nr:bifunctional metallophosphatase/5'-nucleotidase [Deltaproteobacteria bacterium]
MGNKSTSIYVDLDDVLCETARRFLVIVEREFGKRISYEQLTDFDIGTACDLRSEERDSLYRIVHEPDELMQMAPIDAAIAALTQWANAGFKIAIVTGRPPASYEPSLAWLAQHRVAYDSFTMVNKYGRFATDNTVAISLDELAARDYCWAVEDSLPMAQYLAGRMNLRVALIDCPWNRSAEDHANVGRFSDWATIAQAMPPQIRR